MDQKLSISASFRSIAGSKACNEDCAISHVPQEKYLRENKGVILAIADGVSSAEAGGEASYEAINRFVDEYFKAPNIWSVAKSGQNILSILNLHLYKKSLSYVLTSKGYLTTFSAVVIKGKTAHFFHVGDSRIYHLRDNELKQCTNDHFTSISDERTSISRAIGMDSQLDIDYGKISLEEGDRFLLTTDGVHDFIEHDTLTHLLSDEPRTDVIIEKIIDLAVRNDSNDNISAVTAVIDSLPSSDADDPQIALNQVSFPPHLTTGMEIDGYTIERKLFSSDRSHIYLVRDTLSNKCYAMKTPSLNYEDDDAYITRFIREEWVGSRVSSPYIVKVEYQSKARHYLYYLMDYVQGVSLDKWIQQNQPPSPKQVKKIIASLTKGVMALHENGTIHQNLKPENIIILPDHTAVILDFGSVYVSGLCELADPREQDQALELAPYSDPLLLLGNKPGFQTDVYSLACIVYETFTGHLPFNDKIEACRSKLELEQIRYVPAASYNAVIPVWFDSALEKSLSFDTQHRYATVESMMKDMLEPNPDFLKDDPLVNQKSNQLVFWKLISGFWLVTLLLLAYFFSKS